MRQRFWSVALAVGVLVAGLLVVPSAEAAVGPQNVRGSDARPVRRADGHVDTPATIGRLKALHANVHMFLVQKPDDWDDLRLEFAPAAQAAGIKVWVYLSSPSECKKSGCSLPYRDRYEDWACAIALLSSQYPVVTAWALDDFANDDNEKSVDPARMSNIRSLSRAIQPKLEFYPVVYFNLLDAGFLDAYTAVIDAVIMPFRDDPHRNTQWTGTLRAQVDSASSLVTSRGRKLLLMVYARGVSDTQLNPDVDYVRRITQLGMDYTRAGTIAGVIQYGMPLTPGVPQAEDFNPAHGSGNGALVLTVRADQKTSAGNWAAATTHVFMDPHSSHCQVRLWHSDNRGAPSKLGYHFKQVLVTGVKIWDHDVAGDETDWSSTLLDLTPYFTNQQAILSLRLYEKAGVSNYQVRVQFDDITTFGCSVGNPSFETVDYWAYTRSGGYVLASQHIYDPVYSTTVFNLIADLYTQ